MGLKSIIYEPFCTIAPKFHSKFSQKLKNRSFKNSSQKMTKICSFQGLKNCFGIQWQFRIFWHVSRIQKSRPKWRCQKVEVDTTPCDPWVYCRLIAWLDYHTCESNVSILNSTSVSSIICNVKSLWLRKLEKLLSMAAFIC